VGPTGTSEIRATYGGFFAALGLWCLVSQREGVFVTVGFGWLGAALGRIGSVIVDRNVLPKNLGGVAFELILGLTLLSGGWGLS